MKRRCMMATVVLTLMMALLEGCGGSPETDNGSEVLSAENGTEEDGSKEEESKENGTAEDTAEDDKAADETAGTEQAGQDDGTDDSADGIEKLDVNEGDMFIGGRVRSVSSDSFVISRTLVDDELNIITLPGEGDPEEELVTVRCGDSTIYERWTIQGSGESIDKTEAAFSEIKADDGLEVQGYFDGEEFVAAKVIIEVYK